MFGKGNSWSYPWTVLLLLGGALLVVGCGQESGTGTIHPVEDQVPHFHDPDHTIEADAAPEEGLAAQFAAATPIHSIGVRDEGGPELFGEIGDVIVDAQGRILVLDSENREVRIFAPDGRPIGSFGRQGEAPGEFQYPAHLDLFEDGTLVVAGRSGRVQFFESSGKTYERTGGFHVEFTPEDACLLEETLYLHGALAEQSEQSIHVYSRDGTRQRSFGPVYQSENPAIRQRLSSGNIACARSTNRIIFAFGLSPLVYGYAPDGKLQWVSRIEPFDAVPVEQTGQTGLQYKFGTPGGDLITNLSDVPGSGIVAQREHVGAEMRDEWYSYWVSAREGTGGYIGESIPGPIHFVDQKRLLAGPQAPFPKVDVYSAEEIAWEEIDQSSK